jgi:hypothetical protein
VQLLHHYKVMLSAPEPLATRHRLIAYDACAGAHPPVAKVLGDLQAALSANAARLG